jgi:hypothetical protein
MNREDALEDEVVELVGKIAEFVGAQNASSKVIMRAFDMLVDLAAEGALHKARDRSPLDSRSKGAIRLT